MKTQTRYKFLREGLKSASGNLSPWIIGQWRKQKGEISLCNNGFHCSKGAYQAFSYVQGEVLAVVEVKGKHETQADKEVWEQMRIVKAYKWTQKDSILFSCFAARLALKNYESLYPDDDRIRKAIEAGETYALEPSDANKEAARSAAEAARSAAWSAAAEAWAAWSAARSAAWSAAAEAAWSAAWSAEAARSAAWSAEAARSAEAAKKKLFETLDKWMADHIKNLEEIK